jgi:hypothetical protein
MWTGLTSDDGRGTCDDRHRSGDRSSEKRADVMFLGEPSANLRTRRCRTAHQRKRWDALAKMPGQLMEGPAEAGIAILGGHIARRFQHELSSGVSWMGHDQPSAAADQFAMQDDIQIDRAGVPTPAALTTQLLFNTLQ